MNTPIIFLTARDDEIDRVIGLEIGGDDYIIKPFSMRELVARVKARLRTTRLLRKSLEVVEEQDQKSNFLSSGNLSIDLIRHEAQIHGKAISLQPKEFDLLYFLIQNKGKNLSREVIFTQVWGWNYIGKSRTVDVHIRWLRGKIEVDPEAPLRIVTVRGSGYRFEE